MSIKQFQAYMQQRYYDPVIGRFLSVDPVVTDTKIGGNFNRYWYGNDNPYKFTDSDGRQPAEFKCQVCETAGKQAAVVEVAVKNNDMNTAQEAASGVEQVSGVDTHGIAKNLDRASLALDAASLATTELPPVSAVFEVASTAATAGAFLAEPTAERAVSAVLIVPGMKIAERAAFKAAGEVAKNSVKGAKLTNDALEEATKPSN